jgi:hypothetical protein
MKRLIYSLCMTSLFVGCGTESKNDESVAKKDTQNAQLTLSTKPPPVLATVTPTVENQKDDSKVPLTIEQKTLEFTNDFELQKLVQSQVAIGQNCMGTLVSPKIVLTSASCLLKKNENDGTGPNKLIEPSSLLVTLADKTTAAVAKSFVPEDFELTGNDVFKLDVGVVELSSPVLNAPKILIAAASEWPTAHDIWTSNLQLAFIKSPLSEAEVPATSWAGFLSAFGMAKDPVTLLPKKSHITAENTSLEFLAGLGERNVCKNQAGAGAFVKIRGVWKLMGIASRSLKANAPLDCGSEGFSSIYSYAFAAANHALSQGWYK